MAGKSRRPSTGRTQTGGHRYPRSARLSETLREIIADDLVRFDDERLEFVTITNIVVDNELNRAVVYLDSLAGEDGDPCDVALRQLGSAPRDGTRERGEREDDDGQEPHDHGQDEPPAPRIQVFFASTPAPEGRPRGDRAYKESAWYFVTPK